MRFIIKDSAINPYSGIVPLVTVVLVTMIKQAFEDILRRKSDVKENNKKVQVLSKGSFKVKKSKNIKCGNIIKVDENSTIPCDMILIYSSNSNKSCFITTANLDGESNLKIKQESIADSSLFSEDSLNNFKGVIVCDEPNLSMYDFKGKIITETRDINLCNQNLLLRGSCLKMTKFIYGCAIYTGKDTKMALNYNIKSNKISSVEINLNRLMFIFFIILAILTILSFGLSINFLNTMKLHWYLRSLEYIDYFNILIDALGLYAAIISVFMYVCIELDRFFGKKFFEWDEDLYDETTNTCAIVNNTDVNEDLGQIEYLFCDKTGTLTINEMTFRQCYIDGSLYEERYGILTSVSTNSSAKLNDINISRFFEVLCLCHSIHIDSNNQDYQASSPDEYALLKFCQKLGIIYKGEKKENITSLSIKSFDYVNRINNYEILHTLEFDTTRKRMSVIVRCMNTQKIFVLCKGADSSVIEKSIHSTNIQLVNRQINEFALVGWRTLVIAFKEIDQTQLDYYNSILRDAYNDISSQETKLNNAFDIIESNFIILGATGIEDRLQDDCAITLELLREAGIKVWVLTGDKTETAVNISQSCKHFSKNMKNNLLTNLDKNEIVEKLKDLALINEKLSQSITIDGKTLSFIFDESNLKTQFLEICLKCDAVLCCRMSPKQKGQIVCLINESPGRPVTAAIGDGANDVSMIQEANVGIGIFGNEGRNAALSADFAISKFKHLKKAILFHGILYYTRVAILVQYFFYKNLAFVLCQFYYSFYHAFSGQNLFHTIVLNLFNITLSSIPILFYGLFEQRYNLSKFHQNSKLYKHLSKNRDLTIFQLAKWLLFGLWHSIVAFYSTYFFLNVSLDLDGHLVGHTSFGLLVTFIMLSITHVKLIIEWHFWSVMFFVGFVLSFLFSFITIVVPSSNIVSNFFVFLTENQSLYWVSYKLLGTLSVWLCIVVSTVMAIIPDLILKVYENNHQQKQDVKIRKVTKKCEIESSF